MNRARISRIGCYSIHLVRTLLFRSVYGVVISFAVVTSFGQPGPVVLVDRSASIDLTEQMLVFEDPTATLDIDSIVNLPANRFARVSELIERPDAASAVWVKLYFLLEEGVPPGDWILSVGNHRSPDQVTMYSQQGGHDFVVGYSGVLRPAEHLAIKDRTNSKLPIHLTNDTTVAYLKLLAPSKRKFALLAHLETPAYAIRQTATWTASQGVVHGALLIMGLFGFLVFLIDRDKAYLFYSLYLLNLSLLLLGLTGMAADVLGLNDPSNFIYIGQATQCLSSIFYFNFARYFTDLDKHVPQAMKWIKWMVWLNLLLIVLQSVSLVIRYDYNIINGFAGLKSIVDVVLIVYLSDKLLRTRKRINYYFVAGSAALILSGLATVLLAVAFNTDSGPYAHEVGALLDVAIFSVGLGHRMKLNEREKRVAQQQLINQLKENQAFQENINRELERKVKERTQEILKQSEEIVNQNKKLQQSNEEKEVLLSEIHHRVKNNLQIISSLLSIQSFNLQDETAKMALWVGQSRVQAMGLIHENIYKADAFANLDMQVYFSQLTKALIDSMGSNVKPQVFVSASGMKVNIDTAIPLGLITNELVTNCLKHAFHEVEDPQIEINMNASGSELSLIVKDNGSGNVGLGRSTFGLRLVERLTEQLQGTMKFEKNGGLAVKMNFPQSSLS